MIVPNGSGTANAPNSASVAGDSNRFLNERRSMKVTAAASKDFGAAKLTVLLPSCAQPLKSWLTKSQELMFAGELPVRRAIAPRVRRAANDQAANGIQIGQ
jgi:hypothetical protein